MSTKAWSDCLHVSMSKVTWTFWEGHTVGMLHKGLSLMCLLMALMYTGVLAGEGAHVHKLPYLWASTSDVDPRPSRVARN